jgi:cytochrome d ubiquinol oxidase subunit II
MRLEDAVGACVLGALIVYAVSGGADYGAGVWDLFASGRDSERQRAAISGAIAPIWEADHVWLIAAIVMLFMGLPGAFTAISIWLHIPLLLMLLGVVLRGSAFIFRHYGSRSAAAQRVWGAVFSAASVVTPVMLGVIVAAVAAGRIPTADEARQSSDFVSPWFAFFPFCVGGLTLALFSFLAAVYLCVEAEDDALREAFRRRALAAGFVAGAMAWLAFFAARLEAPALAARLVGPRWTIPFHAATAAAAVGALGFLFARRYRAARLLAAAQVALVVLGWGLAQYPYALPPSLTLSQAAAPPVVLKWLLAIFAAGLVVVMPAFACLMGVFKKGAKT